MPHPDDVSSRTLHHYESNAARFWEGTRDHDVLQNLDALLDALPKDRPLTILDFGCGPGRDLVELKRRGHVPVGLDGAAAFVAMARAHAGCEVWHQDFLKLDLPPSHFDGIFANASLFHVPSDALPRVLRELFAALKPGGALFCSNPRGSKEGWSGERYGCWFERERWAELFGAAGFTEVRHYYRPEGKPRDEQPWLAMVWRRP